MPPTRLRDWKSIINCADGVGIATISTYVRNVRVLTTGLIYFLIAHLSSMNIGILKERDRDSSTSLKQRGGGVLIAVRSDYPSSLIKLPSNFCEEIYVSLLIENKEYVFGGVYLPPDSGLDVYHHHVSSVDYLLTRCPNSAFCIAGDYNMPGISWQNGDAGLLPVSSGAAPWESEVCDSLTFLGLLQLNNILNHNSVVLDLVFSTSGQLSVEKSDVNLVPPDLHHPSLTIDIPLSSTSICFLLRRAM
ncbi:hypothetical protein QE152_g27520 [Popillia japonica]|uniref:Endonuclease/exonuclease/phosphatase domain-containing protein n=1 Tax=Popillia japonica TaxID=7064 RepID=A0AAW1JU16_POPJA